MSQGVSLVLVCLCQGVCTRTYELEDLISEPAGGLSGEPVPTRAGREEEGGGALPEVRSLARPHVLMTLARPQFPCGEADPSRTRLDAPL